MAGFHLFSLAQLLSSAGSGCPEDVATVMPLSPSLHSLASLVRSSSLLAPALV